MNEAQTRADLIDPALKATGWGVGEVGKVQVEEFVPGRIQPNGRRVGAKRADYVLVYRNQKLGVIEAKQQSLHYTEGLEQGKAYASTLGIRFVFATNGEKIYQFDLQTGKGADVDRYPTPTELWAATYAEENEWRNRFAEIPYETRSGFWEPRYYQHIAINRVMEAIAAKENRILLTLATGTGKTAIAFQIAWKLFHTRWNLQGDGKRRPRILFLADRNILASQAMNAFAAFPEDAIARIDPSEIRKKGRVPKNANLFFTIFQTFMSSASEDSQNERYDEEDELVESITAEDIRRNFNEYPEDFFDFVIVDECHRGGANDESSWRGILDYFSPAVQLGLTATPKRTNNANTYSYFGEPVYTYSLKQGINDGFLTPFRVKQISTTLDEYVYTKDDDLIEGDIEEGRRYTESEFNRIIEIPEREKYRVKLFMDMIDQREKTLVFCANQRHALVIRDAVNAVKQSDNPDYCVRVTADDSTIGDNFLKQFQDNEKTIPTIITTSRKLSTGVDARNVRNIVLLRPIKSLIEFNQIIGRGTRQYEGKSYFTIYDFVKAYEHFNDSEWDGDPDPCEVCGELACICEKETREDPVPTIDGGRDKPERAKTIKVKLADGKERSIQSMTATTFWSPDGKPMSSAEFIQSLYGEIPNLFKSENQLRQIWSNPDTRKKLLEGLEEKGFGFDQLQEISLMIDAKESDIYDVLAYIAYAKPPITRELRVLSHKDEILMDCDNRQRVFIEFVLSQYVQEGVTELSSDKLPNLIELKYHSISDAISELGSIDQIRSAFLKFQPMLYSA